MDRYHRYHRELLEVIRSIRQALHEIGEERAMAESTGAACDEAVDKIDEFVEEFEE